MKKKEKIAVNFSLDKKLNEYMNELFSNKSKYIEWLIEQDLLKNDKEEVKKIIL